MPFDVDAPWRLADEVGLRPEPFGALLYHFGSRRLSVLKEPALAGAVAALDDEPSARAACRRAGIDECGAAVVAALEQLARSGMIVRREPR